MGGFAMSELIFIKAPARPAHFTPADWSKAWIGLRVRSILDFPMSIGFLGNELVEQAAGKIVCSSQRVILNSWAEKQWKNYYWVAHDSLRCAGIAELEDRSTLLKWLEEPDVKKKQVFAISFSVVDYLP